MKVRQMAGKAPRRLAAWAWLLALAVFVGAGHAQNSGRPAPRAQAKARAARTGREHWRREAVGRWVTEICTDAFLTLRKDGTYESGYYRGARPRVEETGTYTVTADGSVAASGGTYRRRGDFLFSALGPCPWMRWHKESGPHRPLVLAPQPHPIP